MSIVYPINPRQFFGVGTEIVERLNCCGRDCYGFTGEYHCPICGAAYDLCGNHIGSLEVKSPKIIIQFHPQEPYP